MDHEGWSAYLYQEKSLIMSVSTQIDKVAIYVEVNGKTFIVNLPQDRLQLGIKLISGLSDDGALPLAPSPDVTFKVK